MFAVAFESSSSSRVVAGRRLFSVRERARAFKNKTPTDSAVTSWFWRWASSPPLYVHTHSVRSFALSAFARSSSCWPRSNGNFWITLTTTTHTLHNILQPAGQRFQLHYARPYEENASLASRRRFRSKYYPVRETKRALVARISSFVPKFNLVKSPRRVHQSTRLTHQLITFSLEHSDCLKWENCGLPCARSSHARTMTRVALRRRVIDNLDAAQPRRRGALTIKTIECTYIHTAPDTLLPLEVLYSPWCVTIFDFFRIILH